MAIQTSYAATHAAALEGMVANSEPAVIVSRVVETGAGIGFGKIAQRGTADNQIKVSSASPKYLGITVLDPGQPADLYAQYATAAVMTKGVIWVQASVAVAAGDPVYFVPATGVITNVSTSNVQIPNATFDSSTSGAGLAKVRLG
ncbi:DUF2190 domain-containing protein [Alsobacter sp. KACC 23698]|uniref:DUF2190 domain-containing protein n=1 Tax=Alsobacter sp. KACC 23698 TaxID=3149229 RepID=A0AAU7JNA2_9HYPH